MTSEVQNKLDNALIREIYYGTCSTPAGTAEKAITIDGNWKLEVGNTFMVLFSESNTASNPTFNVNNTGAKSVWYNQGVITTSNLSYAGYANRPQLFMYDGTNYVWISHSTDSNTTYTNASLGQGYGTCTTPTATQDKAVTLANYTLTVGGFVAVKFTYAVGANARMNIRTRGVKPIFCNGSAIKDGMIQADDTAFFIYDGTNYILLGTTKSSLNSTPVTLYSGNSSGSNITLSETASNFRYIEILFSEMIAQSPIQNSMKIEHPNGKNVSLSVTFTEGGKYYNTFTTYNFNGTVLTVDSFGTLTVNSSGVSSFDSSEDNIEILKVVGYRK